MRINNNMAAMNAWRNLSTNGTNMAKSLERLSSGFRINKAADDAAGLAVSEKMRAQIRGINMATRNTQDAVSMVQTAEGGASKIQEMLQRMRELAVQAGSDTLQDTDRTKLSEEFKALQSEIDRTAGSVTFNGKKLINGEVGANGTISAGNEISNVRVDSNMTASGTFTVDVTQLAREQVIETTGSLKDDGSAATIGGGADLAADFGTAFGASDELRFTQEGKTLVYSLNGKGTMTAAQLAADINSAAQSQGFNFQVSYGANKFTLESNVDGTHGDVGVNEIMADSRRFGFTNTTQTSQDAAATIAGASGFSFKGNEFQGGTGTLQGVKFTATASGGTASSLVLTKNEATFQVGANKGETIATALGNLTTTNLGVGTSSISIGSKSNAANAIETLDGALSTVSGERAKMGAMQNRLENAISTLQTQNENLTAAESRIRDLDMAAEMAQFTKHQVLQQASTSMLAQANQLSQGVLSLLQ
ncbi:MAG: fliC [Symbiobacteriaceae bacterium]|jgi:flagellin|nr:fliC [Symbiobacteriaceae bacterium]